MLLKCLELLQGLQQKSVGFLEASSRVWPGTTPASTWTGKLEVV